MILLYIARYIASANFSQAFISVFLASTVHCHLLYVA